MLTQANTAIEFDYVFFCEAATLYQLWTDGAAMKKWWTALDSADLTPKLGSTFHMSWKGPSGCSESGKVMELLPSQRVVFTWGSKPDSKVTVNITALASSWCRMQFSHVGFKSEEDIDDCNLGWTCAMLELDAYINAPTRDLSKCPSVLVTEEIDSTPEAVFRAFTTPELMNQWMNRTGATTGKATNELKVGRNYRMDYVKTNGDILVALGEYLAIEPNKFLAFTWTSPSCPYESKVELQLTPSKNGCTATIVHRELATPDMRAMHQSGWTSCLAALNQVVKTI